jgi:hypothetical protein
MRNPPTNPEAPLKSSMTALEKKLPNAVAQSAIAVVAACKRYDGYGKKKEIVRPEWGLFTISPQESAAFYADLNRERRTILARSATNMWNLAEILRAYCLFVVFMPDPSQPEIATPPLRPKLRWEFGP